MGVFSVIEIRKTFPELDSKRLVEWQEKGYIKKLINKWYIFADLPINEPVLYRISNCLHQPSYISLESALSYYQLIPEAVYTLQAVSTRKTILYETPIAAFQYRTIKPSYYFGYTIVRSEPYPVLIADIEKAMLDYLYLTPGIKSIRDVEAIRLNWEELHRQLDWEKLLVYASIFDSPTLNKRITLVRKLLQHANASGN